jgi:hypothetical protein
VLFLLHIYVINEESISLWLQQTENILGYLWHRYSIAVMMKAMVMTSTSPLFWCEEQPLPQGRPMVVQYKSNTQIAVMNASWMDILQSSNNSGCSHMSNKLLPVVVGGVMHNGWHYTLHYPCFPVIIYKLSPISQIPETPLYTSFVRHEYNWTTVHSCYTTIHQALLAYCILIHRWQ